METFYFKAELTDEGERLDKYLSEEMEEISRSYLQKLIKQEQVLVDGHPGKAGYRLRAGEQIAVTLPQIQPPKILPENILLDILYEDEDIIVVNKPKGMVVHPAAGHLSGTLVNALMYHCKGNLSGINGVGRPGIVHRIDMNTTGALVACKNDFAHKVLADALSVHQITRVYECICYNRFHALEGTIDAPIGRNPSDRKKMAVNRQNGRRAVTHYKVLEQFEKFAHVECRLETGRTHQIRVHMASISHPLLGDDTYCSARATYRLEGQTLHAGILGFVHPRSRQYMEFKAPRPEYFERLLEILRGKKS